MELVVVALTAFILIMPVELPDKTFVATLVLSTRYPALPVWLGVVAAFGVQCAVATGAGQLLTRLPEQVVGLMAAGFFAVGAVIMLAGARTDDTKKIEQEYEDKVGARKSGLRAAGASFLVLFTAEWGDLSQLLAAGLVASGKPAVGVFIGAWAALAVVSGFAVLLGRWLLRHVRLALVRYVAAGVCAILAVITAVSVL